MHSPRSSSIRTGIFALEVHFDVWFVWTFFEFLDSFTYFHNSGVSVMFLPTSCTICQWLKQFFSDFLPDFGRVFGLGLLWFMRQGFSPFDFVVLICRIERLSLFCYIIIMLLLQFQNSSVYIELSVFFSISQLTEGQMQFLLINQMWNLVTIARWFNVGCYLFLFQIAMCNLLTFMSFICDLISELKAS